MAFEITALLTIAFHIHKTRQAPWSGWFLVALLVQIWALILLNHVGISGWDDIAQWAPNSLYLWLHNSFPAPSLATSYSNRPVYPYALAYLNYLVSFAQGAFVIQAGAMINWLLLASFAWALTEFAEAKRTFAFKIFRLGFAMIMVTLFNPSFNPSFSITGQTDMTTSVLLGFLTLLLLRLHEVLREKTHAEIKALSLQLSLGAVIFVLLRDMNIVLFALLVFASMLISLREKYFRKAILALSPSIGSGFIFYTIWHVYAGHAAPQDKAISILPFAAWHWPLFPEMLRSIGLEMIKKNGFYALMFGTSGFGIWAFLRGRIGEKETLAVMTAVVFIGSVFFIITVFMGASLFSERNITNAMSFYRYGTHTGLMGVAMLWLLYEKHLEPRLNFKIILPATIISFALLPLVCLIKTSWVVPKPSVALCTDRAFGNELAQLLPPGSRLAILDSSSNGFREFIINLELALDDATLGGQKQIITTADGFQPEKMSTALEQIKKDTSINAVLLTAADA